MAQIVNGSIEHLVEAFTEWSGFGKYSFPNRSEYRLLAKFPNPTGETYLIEIRQLVNDYYKSDAHIYASDLQEMIDLSNRDFRSLHPDTDERIIEILAWCYSFDYK
jgi:hypothetical protein